MQQPSRFLSKIPGDLLNQRNCGLSVSATQSKMPPIIVSDLLSQRSFINFRHMG
jgi:hypothetical protein